MSTECEDTLNGTSRHLPLAKSATRLRRSIIAASGKRGADVRDEPDESGPARHGPKPDAIPSRRHGWQLQPTRPYGTRSAIAAITDRHDPAARPATNPWQNVQPHTPVGDQSRWNGLPARPPQRRVRPERLR